MHSIESRCVTGPKHILFAGESVHQIIQPGNVTRWDSEGVNSTTANRDIDSKNQSCDNVESINQSAPSLQPFIHPAPLPSTTPSEEKLPEDGGDVRQHDETEDDDDEGDAQPSSGLSGGPMVRGALLPSACGGQGAPVQDQLVLELLRYHLHFLPGQVQRGGTGSLAAAARAMR